ncbi:hypothetical protein V1226_11425 [Lachnospiraceae bacterium JLR.KK009]|nr:hypothetical protein [Lachnospiraceae bacterium]MCI8882053.1 hypothetical protein [Lachnospiraceae bacterium]
MEKNKDLEQGILWDKKLKCMSAITRMSVGEYLKIVGKAYQNRGGISGQREALKQKTAISIRNRMIEDIKDGTILPPIVIGLVVNEEKYQKLKKGEIAYGQLVSDEPVEQLSIIDGMQRTTALMKAVSEKEEVNQDEIRVEYWISDNSNSLLYRMLILNTGQVPWNVRRQIEVIFSGIIKEIKEKVVNIEVFEIGDSSIRSKGGQYQADGLIELFLAFGARTWKVNTKEKLTDEFTRHDFLQSSGETDLVHLFCDVLTCMAKMDILLDCKYKKKDDNSTEKFRSGKELFARQPARIGFVAAAGEKIMGRPGDERDKEKIEGYKMKFINAIENVVSSIEQKGEEELVGYMDFATLNQMMERRTAKVGDFERELFYEAFKVIVEENGQLSNLGICWRAI